MPSGRKRGTRKQVSPPAPAPAPGRRRHRRRHEPLVAGDAIGAGPPLPRRGRRGIGAHVGAALLLGHAHAERDAGLLLQPAGSAGRRCATGSSAATSRRAPARCSSVGTRGVGHGDRAAVAGLHLGRHVEAAPARATLAPGAGLRRLARCPRPSRAAPRRCCLHQRVVGGMELDRRRAGGPWRRASEARADARWRGARARRPRRCRSAAPKAVRPLGRVAAALARPPPSAAIAA